MIEPKEIDGLAFVLVQHLDPNHESMFAELLSRRTEMPVRQITDGTPVEPNNVYLIPPNASLSIVDATLRLSEFSEPRGFRRPIDDFFRSLAASGHQDSIAVILSGGGTDGSVGIKDVKEVGGLIAAQHPADAEYDGMPRASINTGLVDVILPAGQLASKLVEYIQHRHKLPHDPGQLTEAEVEILQRILAQVPAPTVSS